MDLGEHDDKPVEFRGTMYPIFNQIQMEVEISSADVTFWQEFHGNFHQREKGFQQCVQMTRLEAQ